MKNVSINQARDLLLNGDVVAIPTETVYGLAGWIHSEAGLRKIFSTKERPFFDPLIVHVDTIEKATLLSSYWTPVHQALAEACWPGPLTLIAKKASSVNSLITSGLDSVGLRCPQHDLTLELLQGIEGGLAAPSANKFGKTSPSEAKHVFEEFGEAVSILDGGPCRVGIESTVAGIVEKAGVFKVLIYRPGHYTAVSLHNILLQKGFDIKVEYAESPVAPGQLKHHYMPNIPLVIAPEDFSWSKDRSIVEKKLQSTFDNPVHWILPDEAAQASRELYQDLRKFSQLGHDLIIIKRNRAQVGEDWRGIWNRLEKAKTLDLDLE